MNLEEFDENRQLCDDGNCLGVVVDGKCNVCGRGGSASAAAAPSEASVEMVAEGGHVDDAFDDDDRKLCPDGACTGLLGTDGNCKECGRSAAS